MKIAGTGALQQPAERSGSEMQVVRATVPGVARGGSPPAAYRNKPFRPQIPVNEAGMRDDRERTNGRLNGRRRAGGDFGIERILATERLRRQQAAAARHAVSRRANRKRTYGDTMAQMANGAGGLRRRRAVLVNDVALDRGHQERESGDQRQQRDERSSSAREGHWRNH